MLIPISTSTVPNGYTTLFNATFYEVKFLNTTPVGTILFSFTLYINPKIVALGSNVVISITGNIAGTQFASDHFGFASANSFVYPHFISTVNDYIVIDRIFYNAVATLPSFIFSLQCLVPPSMLTGVDNVGVTIIGE